MPGRREPPARDAPGAPGRLSAAPASCCRDRRPHRHHPAVGRRLVGIDVREFARSREWRQRVVADVLDERLRAEHRARPLRSIKRPVRSQRAVAFSRTPWSAGTDAEPLASPRRRSADRAHPCRCASRGTRSDRSPVLSPAADGLRKMPAEGRYPFCLSLHRPASSRTFPVQIRCTFTSPRICRERRKAVRRIADRARRGNRPGLRHLHRLPALETPRFDRRNVGG